jgi:hypothetical protein
MKRLLLFLLLMSIGIGVLIWAVGNDPGKPAAAAAGVGRSAANDDTSANGDEPAGSAAGPADAAANLEPAAASQETPAPNRPQGGGGVQINQGKVTATMAQRGAFELWGRKPLRQPDGSIRNEDTFLLRAKESQPLPSGQQQLEQPEVTMFDRGKPMAKVTAERAFVVLESDASGRLLLDEGKEIDLRQALLVGVAGSQLAGLRLELGDARIKIGELEVLLVTAADQTVTVQFDGSESATLRGKGAQARLPRNRDGGPRAAEVELLRDVEVDAAGIRVRAAGRLRYQEDIGSGIARLSIADRVQVDLDRGELRLPGRTGKRAQGSASIQADRLLATLLRIDGDAAKQGGKVRWRQLDLTGAPAIAALPEGRLETPRLTAMPSLFGELMQLTAHGGESHLEQTDVLQRTDERLRAQAARRLHLLRPGEQTGAVWRAFGTPRWMLGPFFDLHGAVGEGAAEVASDLRRMAAADGVRMWQPTNGLWRAQPNDDGGILRGRGAVHYEQAATARDKAIAADGNDGLSLLVGPGRERLQLGPREPRAEHRYEVRHGDALLTGTGSCRSELRSDGRHVELVSPAGSIAAVSPSLGLELRNVQDFRAVLTDDDWRELAVGGAPIDLRSRSGDEQTQAFAERLTGLGRHGLRLTTQPATTGSRLAAADRTPRLTFAGPLDADGGNQSIDLTGPVIDLHHIGGRAVLIDAAAVGSERPHLRADIVAAKTNRTTRTECDAERFRLRPWLVSPLTRRLQVADSKALAFAVGSAVGQPWLRIDRAAPFVVDDPDTGRTVGTAAVVLVQASSRSSLFLGDADRGTPAIVAHTNRGRRTTLEGPRVRALQVEAEAGERSADIALQALVAFEGRSAALWPRLTLHEDGTTGLLSHMQAVCRGNIDVVPDAVVFGGPVVMTSLGADGEADPNGLGLDARELRLERQLKSGDIVRARARDVALTSARMQAKAAEIDLDLGHRLCTARDPNGVHFELANGWTFDSPWLEVNYETLAFRTADGRASGTRALGDGSR